MQLIRSQECPDCSPDSFRLQSATATTEQLREQVKAQQLELERLHKGIQDDRKERETAIKEAAELKGQAQALKVQNAELMAKLSELAAEPKSPKP